MEGLFGSRSALELTKSMLDALVHIHCNNSSLLVLLLSGEVHFPAIDFVCQAISQCAECGMTVMGVDYGLMADPLTYTMFMAPVCLSCYL